MKTRRLLLLTLMTASSLLSGCVNVQPWERGNLADPAMTTSNPIINSMSEHMWFSREAASGGRGVGGGGCGCN
jgi:hypothetical protein